MPYQGLLRVYHQAPWAWPCSLCHHLPLSHGLIARKWPRRNWRWSRWRRWLGLGVWLGWPARH